MKEKAERLLSEIPKEAQAQLLLHFIGSKQLDELVKFLEDRKR